MEWLGLIAVVGLMVTLLILGLKDKLDRKAFAKLAETVEEIVDAVKDKPE